VEESPVLFRDFMNDMFVDCATTSLVKLSGLPEYGLIQNLSGTDAVYHSGVYLPCYHQLTFKEQSRVIQAVKLFHGSK
jgi:dTDP-4-amino-4,6-dideoxygalactose transaminase